MVHLARLAAPIAAFVAIGCGGGGTHASVDAGGKSSDAGGETGSHHRDAALPRPPDAAGAVDARHGDAHVAADAVDAADVVGAADAGASQCTGNAGDAGSCYSITCTTTTHTLTENRDRLIADLARRKCTDSCTLWAALSQGERYIFLMVTVYLGAPSSLLYPPGMASSETALDHADALYTINGPNGEADLPGLGLGGNDYNRIYLGFDPLAACVMRNFTVANPTHETGYNEWVKSDDVAGPHAPFTQRDMIAWFKALTDLQTQGPQFHFWHQPSDFTQSGLNARLGVCGVTDPDISEMTIAFDSVHDSDPLGTYLKDGKSNGGLGWQIVDQFVGIDAGWTYMPTGCPMTAPVNTSVTGGGTFGGMGPSSVGDGGACTSPSLADGGSCP